MENYRYTIIPSCPTVGTETSGNAIYDRYLELETCRDIPIRQITIREVQQASCVPYRYQKINQLCLLLCISFLTMTQPHRYLMGRDYPYTASTVPMTSCIVDSAAIHILVVKIWNTIWPPLPQFFLPRRAALTTSSNGTQSALKGKGWGRSRYYYHVYSTVYSTRTTTCKKLAFKSMGMGPICEVTAWNNTGNLIQYHTAWLNIIGLKIF
jgi:hypothetical protein